jgi:hypothetical protein
MKTKAVIARHEGFDGGAQASLDALPRRANLQTIWLRN